jgi:hypothetical protein
MSRVYNVIDADGHILEPFDLGFKGAFLRPNPYNNKMIDHPDYEPFWAAAEDLP